MRPHDQNHHFVRLVIASVFLCLSLNGASAALIAVTGGPDVNFDSSLYLLDLDTGTSTKIGDTGLKHITAIAAHPKTGALFAHRNDRANGVGELYQLDPATAVPTFIGITGISSPSISFGPDDKLYGWMELGSQNVFSSDADDLVTFSLNDGHVTRVGESGINTNQTGMAFDRNGNLFVKSGDADASKPVEDRLGHLYQVNPTTGVGALINVLDANPHNGLDFDADNRAFTFSRGDTGTLLQSINFANGQVTDERLFSVRGITSIAFVTAVPESKSYSWMMLAIAIGWAYRRRRRLTCLG
ncbi:hypothetical protein Poly51_01290 [Rubripirellula tenax]|uniref:SMP-30/Gluconolaconase/LRE-like region n=1 Tax=Rubripirellula tenax TaxID=2528015 RepID=A0A5C6FDK3_9BACT|nr:hypothetical protein [Rubripirellula tenax]TWU59856.1 hypothetical protein Poly51_01290 [Rubripirellula tenax]